MDAAALLLELHARNHSANVAKPALGSNSQDQVLSGLADSQLRSVPQAGLNSIAWVIWHMARSEDQGVHLTGDGAQVFETGNWAAKLKVADRGTGTGHSAGDVSRVSRDIDLAALLDYRAAVGRRTREILGALGASGLDRPVDLAGVRRAASSGAFGETPDVPALERSWAARNRAYAFTVYAVTHNVGHWGEITTIKGLVK